jgi:hypothetical protein
MVCSSILGGGFGRSRFAFETHHRTVRTVWQHHGAFIMDASAVGVICGKLLHFVFGQLPEKKIAQRDTDHMNSGAHGNQSGLVFSV